MSGNVLLFKHASSVPQCAVAIEDVFQRAGFPEGCVQVQMAIIQNVTHDFQMLLVKADKISKLIQDPRIAAVWLTGSTGSGKKVAAEAGKNAKRVTLELGGSDPFIVMPSANLDKVVDQAVAGRLSNNGQSCIASKRFIIHEKVSLVFNDLTELFV